MNSPWGKVQYKRELQEGIQIVSTARHGGLKLDRKRNRMMPDYMRRKGGWYEEDCEVALVGLVFPSLLPNWPIDQTARDYFPDAYERFTGKTIQPGESYEKDRRIFQENHKNDLVVISAKTSTVRGGLVDCWATRGGNRRLTAQRFYVPVDEYRQRSRFGFVIDPTRHERNYDRF